MKREQNLLKQLEVASGRKKASLVLKQANIINVFTNEIQTMDIAIEEGIIVGIGQYDGIHNVDLSDHIVSPGFIDGHIHLESSMVSPMEFEKAVLPHGTTTVITDPHEIANVAGCQGIDYLLEETNDLIIDVFFMMPSCVPSTVLDESGAILDATQIEAYYNYDRVLGLAEVMNTYGVVAGEEEILTKIQGAKNKNKRIDGHAPFLSDYNLNAYICAGIKSDHECSEVKEALEKIRLGQWVMIREGTAAKNLEALIPLCKTEAYQRCMFVTDDKHPSDLIAKGHMDDIIKKVVALGVDPIRAIRMATLHTAQYFGLSDRGAIAPGYIADFVIFKDLKSFQIHSVYKQGKLVTKEEKLVDNIDKDVSGKYKMDSIKLKYPNVFDSFHMEEICEKDLEIIPQGVKQRVIQLQSNELLTTERIVDWTRKEGYAPGVNVEEDILKVAVFERHLQTGHIGLGFLGGYGLKKGAVASSIAHDAHNLIVVGTNDSDIALAGNQVRKNKGGLAIAVDGVILGELALPIAGLMTTECIDSVEEKLNQMKLALKKLGIVETIDAFMTLAFVSLPVIPKLRLNTYGIIDVERQSVVDITFK